MPSFVRRNTRMAARTRGETMRRQDVPEYSGMVLRKVLVSALAHANYSRHKMIFFMETAKTGRYILLAKEN